MKSGGFNYVIGLQELKIDRPRSYPACDDISGRVDD